MEWAVGSLHNEASHGLCLSKVELHGFASNGTFLLPLNAAIHPPSGDNARAYKAVPQMILQMVHLRSELLRAVLFFALLRLPGDGDGDVGQMFMRASIPEAHSSGVFHDCSQ